MLKFFGRGSAFNDMQNSAYYVDGTKLYLIDCPMSSFNIVRTLGLSWFNPADGISSIHILVTHTHSDHIGGIPMLIHYAYYVWHVPVTVGAPSEEVLSDLKFVFERLEGCASAAYTLTAADSFDLVEAVIPTTHTPELEGRCFGFALKLGGSRVIYTGDTNTLLPFLPYLKDAELYTEISASESPVHLYIGSELDRLTALTQEGVSVYLMHLDNEEKVKAQISGTAIRLAPLYNE